MRSRNSTGPPLIVGLEMTSTFFIGNNIGCDARLGADRFGDGRPCGVPLPAANLAGG